MKKDTKQQKEKIFETAKQLFIKNGYNKTSVNNIIKTLDISKGTFYHYFGSKEDLLNEIVDEMVKNIIHKTKKVVSRKDLSAFEKIVNIFSLTIKYKKQHKKIVSPLVEAFYKNENLLLIHKVYERIIKLYVPELEKIIRQGQEEKVFDVYKPRETAEIILAIQYNYFGKIVPSLLNNKNNSIKLLNEKTKGFEWALMRLLGLKKTNKNLINRKDQFSLFKFISKNFKK